MSEDEDRLPAERRELAAFGRQAPWLWFVLALSALALVALVVERVAPLTSEAKEILDLFDFVVCLVFLVDFAVTFARAERKLHYLLTWGWLDLLSSIPAVESLRWARSARIVRILRLFRALRAARLLTRAVAGRRIENAALAVSLVAIIVVAAASVAILQVEVDPASNIRGAEDAIWWALTTITTVGYGDRFPVTTEGRLVATLLMVADVGLFGTLSGLLAAWFVAPEEQKTDHEIEALRREVEALRRAIEGTGK